MKRTVVMMAGLALVAGAAVAQEQGMEEYDQSVVTEDERDSRTGMETDAQSEYGTQTETQTQSDTSTDPYGTESQSQEQTQTTDPYDTQTETGTQDQGTWGAESGQQQMGQDLSQKSSAELSGKSVVSASGEEIGTIEQVGYSEEHQDRVAAVNVGGFLGAGEKIIAIPLSELSMGTDDDLTTSMTRESIEQEEEFDPTQLSTEE